MKQLSLLCTLVFLRIFPLLAQDTYHYAFSTKINQVFQYAEKNRVTTGILKDYGLEILDLNNFAGTSLFDSNYALPNHWFNLYKTVMSCKINSTAPNFVDPDKIMSDADSIMTLGKVPINIAFYKYEKYRDDAYSAGLVTVTNDQIHDKYNGTTWINPYETKYAFGATQMAYFTRSKSVTFQFSNSGLFTNITSGVVYSADFNNGVGWTTLTSGSGYTINYTDTGYKEIKFRAVYNGVTYLSHSLININDYVQNANQITKSFYAQTVVNIPKSGSSFAGCQIQVRYGTNHNNKIIKPLIVLEDVDPYSGEHYRNLTLDQFYVPLIKGFYGANLQNLITSDYDIIYVDWGDGNDLIENNAVVFTSVFSWVRDQLTASGSTEKIVTLGLGMGAVIARWQYKKWENSGVDIKTRLFISYDGPMQGINIPLGIQAHTLYLKHNRLGLGFGGSLTLDDEPVDRAIVAVGRGAVREMLIQNLVWSSDLGLVYDNSFHNNFYSQLATLGYPTTCRNIAVANGSQCATSNPLIEGGELYRFSAHANTRILGDLYYSLPPGWIESAIGLLNGNLNGIVRIIPGKSSIFFNYKVNAAKTNTATQVFYAKTWWQKKMFWLVNINITLDEVSHTTPANVIAYEAYPGSQGDFAGIVNYLRKNNSLPYYDNPSIFGSIVNALTSTYKTMGVSDFGITYPGMSNYVLTTSALDIGLGTTALSSTDYYTKYTAVTPPTGTKRTPFANFICAANDPRLNENHGAITRLEGDWLAKEIAGTPQVMGCVAVCGLNVSPGAGTVVCSSQIFTIQALGGTQATWSISPASGLATITKNADGSSATITRQGTANGKVTVTISFTGPCPSISPISFDVYVGTPPPTVSVTLDCPDGQGIATGAIAPLQSGFTWHVVDVATHAETLYPNYGATINFRNLIGTHNIGCEYKNACGTSPSAVVYNLYCPGSGGHLVAASPNPSTGDVSVEVTGGDPSADSVGDSPDGAPTSRIARTSSTPSQPRNNINIQKIQLFDNMGVLVRTITFPANKGNKAKLHLDVPRTGIYNLVITTDDGTYTKKIQLLRN